MASTTTTKRLPEESESATDLLEKAIMLLSVKAPSTDDSKSSSSTAIIREPSFLRTARSLFSINKEYRFRMHSSSISQITSSGGGTLLGTIPVNAADTSYSDFSALALLFDELRLSRVRIRIMPLIGSNFNENVGTSATIISPNILMAFSPMNRNTIPGGAPIVYRQSTVFSFNPSLGNGIRSTLVKSFSPEKGRLWCTTGSVYVQSPAAGMLGSFDYCADISASASVGYFSYILEADVDFRVRG
jgi:hypothetical protein